MLILRRLVPYAPPKALVFNEIKAFFISGNYPFKDILKGRTSVRPFKNARIGLSVRSLP